MIYFYDWILIRQDQQKRYQIIFTCLTAVLLTIQTMATLMLILWIYWTAYPKNAIIAIRNLIEMMKDGAFKQKPKIN